MGSRLNGLAHAERRRLLAERHSAPTGSNISALATERLTVGERLADAFTGWLGSWPFITVQGLLLVLWIALNTIAWRDHWDPYPFILLNLALSFQAAFAAPIILMSQNRQSAKDREKAEADYVVDRQSEMDIAAVHARLDELAGRQWDALVDLQRPQLALLGRIEALTGGAPADDPVRTQAYSTPTERPDHDNQ